MKLSFLILLVSAGSAFASQPGSPGDRTFIPSGGGYKGAAKVFPLFLETDACDQGFLMKLVKSPGLAQRYRLFLQETYRAACTKTTLSTQLEIYNVEVDRKAGDRVLYKSTQGTRLITLSDRRGLKTDQPAWVVNVDGVLYQSTSVSDVDLP